MANKVNKKSKEKNEIVISIPIKKGEPLGVTPNEQLIIVQIQSGTKSEENLHIGDQIIALNGIKLKNQNHLKYLLSLASPIANITVIRDDKKSKNMESNLSIPLDRRCNITRRDGYKYELITINLIKDKKLGLRIRHFQNRVLVSSVEPLSICSAHLKTGDHICDIDGLRVTDKNVCKKLLTSLLKTNKKVSLVIERPDTPETIQWANKVLEAPELQQPSVKMSEDVVKIAMRERSRLKSYGPPEKSLLRRDNYLIDKTVTFEENIYEYKITSDYDGKKLRSVRKE
ncbi:PDZ domain-containing protein [Strongyloides ratti]|uniref:PDZ domain-containing protein n=1 Tax=Strongyloides ratti TaxID=34506 RepID=A0A090MZW3_STRRB|nr:PDZ domain-containing protein [Strongyloides ratti]CEF69635.1 PDZ domain-containing protein [Strongyloides ratti]